MFSGIIKSIGKIQQIERTQKNATIVCSLGAILKQQKILLGDSIAVNGVCLTVTSIDTEHQRFSADVSVTTLEKTTLGNIDIGDKVNLEPALLLNEAVNGHLVSGHIDAVTTILEVKEVGFSRIVKFKIPRNLSRFIVSAGSVSLDGVSLTINKAGALSATLTLVPHTMQTTILHTWQKGSLVNLEIDLVARYLLNQ